MNLKESVNDYSSFMITKFIVAFFFAFSITISLAYSQSQITISAPSSSACIGSVIKIRVTSFSGVVTLPIDYIQKREFTSGVWGAWTNVSANFGYDGVSWYWNVTLSAQSEFRAKEPVSGGTIYSNVVSINNQYLPRLLLYGQDQGGSTNFLVASQGTSISFSLNLSGASNVSITWYKNGIQVTNNLQNGLPNTHQYPYYGSTFETWKAYVYNNQTPGACGAFTNEITIKPDTHIRIGTTANGSVSAGEIATINVLSYYGVNWNEMLLEKTDFINGAWTGWSNSGVSVIYTGYSVRFNYSITRKSKYRVYVPVSGGRIVSGIIEFDVLNSISTFIPLNAISSESKVRTQPVDSVVKSTNYFDGIGRSLQSVLWQGSPLKNDIVQPVTYDGLGREHRKYLPVSTNTTDGWYKTGILDAVGNYAGLAASTYGNNLAGKIAQDGRPFLETIFEASPSGRPIREFSPGADWFIQNKPVQHRYLFNTHSTASSSTQEKVIAWKLDAAGLPIRATELTGYIQTGGYYNTNQLSIKSALDERGNAVREYVNKTGQTVLKKVQVVNDSTNLNSTTDWSLTYYIYDDFGDLRYVLQPELSKIIHEDMSNLFVPLATNLTNFAFQYKYDAGRKMITKKIPGAKPVYMVYDKRGRLILSQEGNQRRTSTGTLKKEWLYTKYDAFNRPIITGLYVHALNDTSQSEMQTYVNSQMVSGNQFYEDYSSTATTTHGYTNRTFPSVAAAGSIIYTVTYYDNYKFVTDLALGSAYNFFPTDITGQKTTNNSSVLSQVTGSKVNILNSSNYLWNVSYYDDKYRVIQNISQNTKAGTIRTTNVVDFPGRVLTTKRTYLVNGVSTNIKETFAYDHAGRPISVKHSVNGAADVVISKNTYNEIGQLVDKQLHSTDFTNFKQSVDYRYNIRGWLTSINNAALTSDAGATNDDATDYFGMSLNYNTIDSDLSNSALYNGTISGMKWSNYAGTIGQKGNTYAYDAMNRITGSVYKQKTTSWTIPANNGFTETGYTYDLNGNILTMQRNDKRVTGWMDNLKYNYGSGATASNKLLKVEDLGDDNVGFIDGNATLAADFTTATDDYRYDANGNMINDRNKGIGTSQSDNLNIITYNYLNLPETVNKGGNTIRYFYDATGRKLSQVVIFGATQKQTDYVGEYTYENDVLQYIGDEEGRIVMSSTKLIYTNSFPAVSADIIAIGATKTAFTGANTEKYVAITASNNTGGNGAFPIGGSITVVAGERYRIRIKGYGTTNPVFLQVKTGIQTFTASLPSLATNETWVEQTITIPIGAGTLQVGAVWGATVANGEMFYLNELDIAKLETVAPEYQYNLKDHLGNVRVTFTTKLEVDTPTATFEDAVADSKVFKNVNTSTMYWVSKTAANNTSPGQYVLRMNNSYTAGPAKTLSVLPGDVVNPEVWSYFEGSNGFGATNQSLSSLIISVAAAFGGVPGGAGESGMIYNRVNAAYTTYGSPTNQSNTNPTAHLNYILFDKDYNLLDMGWQVVPSLANMSKKKIQFTTPLNIKEVGFMYVYLSYSGDGTNWVYFDDLKITHTKSPVIAAQDYYPFGLQYNSYTRENTVKQDYLYNGKEIQDELNLDLYDYIARQYDPAVGRFTSTDPAADLMRRVSPYAYAYNNPLRFTDPDGMVPDDEVKKEMEGADGLTNSQWVEASRHGQDPNRADEYREQNEVQKKKERIDDILAEPENGIGQTREEMLLPVWKDVLDGTITFLDFLFSLGGKSKGLAKYEKILERLGTSGEILEMVKQGGEIYNKQFLDNFSGARLADLNDYNALLSKIHGRINTHLSEVQKVYDTLPRDIDEKANARNRLYYGEQIYKLRDKLDVVSREINSVKILIQIRHEEQKQQH